MAALKPQYVGKTYGHAWALSHVDAGNVNGLSGAQPRLTNGQLAALTRAWKRCAARSRSPSWPIEYELTIAALGWNRPGDKFIMTSAHANEPAPIELVTLFWNSALDLAERLDADGTALNPLIVDWSYAGYEQSARDAWQQMQRESAKPTVVTSATAPISTSSSSANTESSGGGGGVLLLLLLLLAGGGKKRKGR